MIDHGTPTLLLAAALLGVASGGLAAQQTQGDLVVEDDTRRPSGACA